MMKKLLALILSTWMMTAFCVGALADVTLEEAKQIALERAGATAEDAVFTQAHHNYEDGREVIDLEFYVGTTEYDADVDVKTGEISEFEMEEHALIEADGAITVETAKAIALAKAGMREDQVRFTKAHRDAEDGRVVYEIEYVVNGMEYEFDIDAASGAIIAFDADMAD